MTANNSTEEKVVESVAAVLKPDIKTVSKEHIKALLKSQTYTQGEVEVSDIRGGSEKSGTSSGIVIFRACINGSTGGYVLRFAPYDNELRIFSEYDIVGQFHIQRILNEAGLRVPKALCYETTREFLPQPGFVMERIDGDVADANAFASGFFHDATDEQRATIVDEILEDLVECRLTDFDYFRKLAAFPGLVTIASMGRAMPKEHQDANARLAEPLWAVAESR